MINDTRLREEITITLPGYSLIRTDKNTGDSTAGGTAIAVPSNWDVELVPNITESGNGYEATGIITTPPGCPPMKLLTIYNHPQNHAPQHLLNEFINVKSNNRAVKGIIGGDFNCPHEAFSSRFSNIYGTGLLNIINNLNLMTLINEEPTTFHHGEPNILDLFICEPNSCSIFQECYVGESIGSDHLPLIAHAKISTSSRGNFQKTKTIFDQNGFNDELQLALSAFDASCISKSQVDIKLSQLTCMIQEVKANHTSVIPWRHKRMHLSEETLSWIQTRKKLLKEMKKVQPVEQKRALSQLYNRANKIVKELLEENDNKEREKAILEMQHEKDTSKMWQRYKTLKNNLEPNNAMKRPLTDDSGDKISTPEEKAEIFAQRLEQVHQTPNHPLFDHQFKEQVNAFTDLNENLFTAQEYPSQEPDNHDPMLQPFTDTNFKEKLNLAKAKSAPGNDGITYSLLQKSPDILISKIIEILNFCLLIGYFPQQWKVAKVVMVPKPGKDHTVPKNYRPISLLPAIAKIFERLICDRLVNFLEHKNILNKFQAGYRKGRSTQEHVLRLSQQVYNGFKQRHCTIAVFLDCEAAFDAVWTKGLMYKMHQLNMPKNFLRLLCSFLRDRSLNVHVEGKVSREVNLGAGTPQGSCLSPILFCIHVNDIPFPEMIGCHPSQFADDIGLWSSGKCTESVGSSVQLALDKIESWCKKWRVKLSPGKTNVILFTKCYKAHINKPRLFLFNEELSYSDEAIFLGVKFNASLTWEPQIRALIAKAQPRLNLLKALTTSTGRDNPELLLRLYKAIVRPIFEYSSIAHVNSATCHQIKLQRIQNAAIRTILKLPNYMHTDILHDASGLPPLHNHIIEFGKKRLTSMRSKSPLIKETIDQFNSVSHILTWKSPLEFLL